MPATAAWTAKRIGLVDYKPQQIADRETNIAIGTAYLKFALDDFEGSMPMAAAAYNAGPGRPRVWRNGPVLEAPVWIENIPFSETRDYVRKVISNTNNYAALLSGQPQRIGSSAGGNRPAPEQPARKPCPETPCHNGEKMMRRILLLGGTGFVGRHVREPTWHAPACR